VAMADRTSSNRMPRIHSASMLPVAWHANRGHDRRPINTIGVFQTYSEHTATDGYLCTRGYHCRLTSRHSTQIMYLQ